MRDTEYAAWCRVHFAHMRDGGVWAVPRSGLLFTRKGDELELTARMPFTDELQAAADEGLDVPADEATLRAYQDDDFLMIQRHFKQAGITVTNGLEAGR